MHESKNSSQKRNWFWLSVVVNLGFLGVFKYYNFFTSSFAEAASLLGMKANITTLNIILPVGISFYTFHGLSYVIDIYKDRIKPERNFVTYSVFVSFFPLLVAGPIERAKHLLPQIQNRREFNSSKAIDGLRQILWGLFKKIVIADTCAEFADTIFNNSNDYSGLTLVMGAIFFAFQIYGDFSGYSDIAIGTARLLGIDLLRNFAFPYFSRDIAEFWRRWHISLSSWFRDYVYIPLGGSKVNAAKKIRNIFIIFLLSGFWHGANWTFLIWGALNAIYFLPLLLSNKNRTHLDTVATGKYFPTVKEFFNMFITFSLVVFAWIFFRSESLSVALSYVKHILKGLMHKTQYIKFVHFFSDKIGMTIVILMCFFICMEWIGRESNFALEKIGLKWKRPVRWMFYCIICGAVIYFSGSEKPFIYFQF